MPTVSVVIPTYNSSRYVTEAVESVLAQTFADLEILVVDDGSSDNTRDVLASYGSPVRYIYQENAGVSVARNTGIAESQGHYVAFLDADDTWLPQKLEKQMEMIEKHSSAAACHTAHILVDDSLNLLGEHHFERSNHALEDLLFRGNAVGTPSSVMVEKVWFERTGGFQPHLSHSADWDMWIRLACHIDFAYIDEPLLKYRWHQSNMSRNVSLIESDTLAVLQTAFEALELPPALRSRRNEALGRQWMVIAGCYFQAGRYRDFVRCAAQAMRHDASQVSYLLAFPLRRLRAAAIGR